MNPLPSSATIPAAPQYRSLDLAAHATIMGAMTLSAAARFYGVAKSSLHYAIRREKKKMEWFSTKDQEQSQQSCTEVDTNSHIPEHVSESPVDMQFDDQDPVT